MYLKNLTLKGFKSFASATTLRFEPGITCVVGPNGSGKSNVVDAITWVLGEQGAKALRGGKMEDVIFAGTAGRPPLGRAEVSLTIDNSDGALPIDYTEVSITRRMFRDGASDYEINGDSCRLLDIQELLSDSGIGREMHVVVGQGQLDAVLQARPEERRAFIEEAAGVLKHRKRKEKALRKLDATAANVTRLSDLTAELRRQLKPLGRQAEIARKAQAVQAELRDARLRLLADDLVTLRGQLVREEADEVAARSRRGEVEAACARLGSRQSALEADLALVAPRLAAAQETWYRLSALQERLRGTVRLAAERARHLAASAEPERGGPEPEELERAADAAAHRERELTAQVTAARATLSAAAGRRGELEATLAAAERAHLAAVRAAADRREGLARLTGQVEALRTRAATTAEEINRLATAAADAVRRAELAEADHQALQSEVGAFDAGKVGLDECHASAVDAYEQARKRVEQLVAAEREAEQDRAHWKARMEALALGLTRRDGAGALLAAGDRLPGLLGSVAVLLTVEPGAQAAVAAALGVVADAVAVAGPDTALAALRLLKAADAGRASLLVGTQTESDAVPRPAPPHPALPSGARWASDLVTAPGSLRPALHQVLQQVAVVDDLDTARELLARHPDLRVVTMAGDVLATGWAVGGSGERQSVLEVQAAVDEATDRLGEAESRLARLRAGVDGARSEESARLADVEAAQEALNASDARLAAVAEKLGRLGQAARSAVAEAARLRAQRETVERARAGAFGEMSGLEQRLASAAGEPVTEEPDTAERDATAASLAVARTEEVDARLVLRTAEERAGTLNGRAESLRRQARSERAARQRAETARAARARGAAVAQAVVTAGALAGERLTVSLARAAQERDAAAAARAELSGELEQVRTNVRELSGELERLTHTVHRDEVARAEQRLRVEQLETRVVEEFGIGTDELVAEYGPDVPVPTTSGELGDPAATQREAVRERGGDLTEPPPVPYDRATQERRARRAERDLATLGKVNPLALEEFAALEERHRFLATQLEDLKATRRDLLAVVREVDDRILEVFAAAFADVAAQFEVVFPALFPGGEGRLLLTDPEDLLSSGVDVEARPPGKKVKRLSLLSGGERSLTAVGMLVAIFRARPSPFYVLDEVEAALDDANLRRLLGLLGELRDSSQLIVVTHQKPTMEIADALYGVSMRGDGISTVVSQRLRSAGTSPPGSPPAVG